MKIGELVIKTKLHATSGLQISLDNYRSKWIVLYFYPKDSTSGCTLEGQDFRDQYIDFVTCNAVIFGVSRDNLTSHERFKMKQNFPFDLISDPDETLCNQFDVMKMKSMYGRQYRGIERSTFLIDPNGGVRYVWRNVKVKGHVSDVLEKLKGFTSCG